jgi:FtsK/SpoIIIE family/FtsK alpha domain/Ftsk gamma domain
MARVRRKPSVATPWNLEIAGIAALGAAALLALAVYFPSVHTGAIGALTAAGLHAVFGLAAFGFPLLVGLIAAIIFLEINVPRMIAKYGGAACAYFLLADAICADNGGMLGGMLSGAMRALLGDFGTGVVLTVVGLGITVWIFDVSLKKLIGLFVISLASLRPAPSEKTRSKRASAPAEPSGPSSLREAFHLPALLPRFTPRPPSASEGSEAAPTITSSIAPTGRRAVNRPVYDDAPAIAEALEVELVPIDDVDDDELENEPLTPRGADLILDAVEREPIGAAVVVNAPRATSTYEIVIGDDPISGSYEPHPTYRLPDLTLFDPPQVQKVDDTSRSAVLEDTLASFGIGAKVTHIERGPSITRYELKPERGVKVSRISALSDDIALALAATSVRIEAPIPGKSAVGIEVPNTAVSVVAIREILEALPDRGTVPPLNMALGKDITGRAVFGDLGKMPHLLVAGATGSGKSVCLNGIIASLLVSATPDQVQMVMIDPKRVELTVYNGIPHLKNAVITDPRLAAGALFEMTKEMDGRYERFAKAGVRKIEEWNAKYPEDKLPYIVIIIDELADLMLVAPGKVETLICRLAQLARATGIHLIVATQRPSVDVITGIIKANIPSRIAFAVSSQVDSRTILDMAGAERLLGRGDMLYLPIDAPKPIRSQGALITGAEVTRLVEFWSQQARPENNTELVVVPIDDEDGKDRKQLDPLCYDAAQFIIESNFASTAQLQTRFSIGHPRAVRLMKQLEDAKVVGPHEGTKPRRILIGLGELEQIAGRLGRGTDSQQELTL